MSEHEKPTDGPVTHHSADDGVQADADGRVLRWHQPLPIGSYSNAASFSWQPIETAPRDGTWVRLRGGTLSGGWDSGGTPPEVVAQYVGGVDDDGVPCWQFAWYDGGFYGTYEKPTHWIRTTPWQPKEEQP